MTYSVLIAAAVLAVSPGKVEQAIGWPALELKRVPATESVPQLVRVQVKGRNAKGLQEWRNPRQTYAVLRTKAGYRAYLIQLGRYVPLAEDLAADGRSARLHPDFAKATGAINHDWLATRKKR